MSACEKNTAHVFLVRKFFNMFCFYKKHCIERSAKWKKDCLHTCRLLYA